ncbi:MAG TPA: hypothetical protein GXX17_07210 [Clostridiales bacterium]|nr:hypothetical protein [Clostridiales bacterium]
MDINKYYDEILMALKEFYESQDLKPSADAPEIYMNQKHAVKIAYNYDKKLFELKVAEIKEGQAVEFNTVASWLFDENHTSRDVKAVAIDFEDTLKSIFGIKTSKVNTKDVSLPTKADSDTPNIDAFTGKFLKLFPEYKDTYREHVSKYGEFLYVDFFKNTAAVKLRELIENKDKSKLIKMIDLLNEFYTEGDSKVSHMIVVVIIGGAFGSDMAKFESVKEYFNEYTHLNSASRAMIQYIAKNKKLQKMLK